MISCLLFRRPFNDAGLGNAPTRAVSNAYAHGWHEHTIRVGGVQRWFRVYVPPQLPAHAPAVVLLHGGTQSMRKIFQRQAGGTRAWLDVAETEGILLLVPNGTNPQTGDAEGDRQNWNDLRPNGSRRQTTADDVGFIRGLLAWTREHFPIDTNRISVTGASNGGMMAFRLLLEMPHAFATAAAFIANLPETKIVLKPPEKATPLLIANGTRDPLIRWEGGEIPGRAGRTLSTDATLAWWIKANRADASKAATDTLPNTDPNDGCRIHRTFYPALPGGAPVCFLKIEGGGHTVPSRDYGLPNRPLVRRWIGPVCRDAEGARLAWDFMKDKTRAP